ncbi:MAG: phosphatidate cytidylyltransferase, partial [Alphaproteobacteria bacterium]|nr:phosphatidate cytidylyltransferase [Alphaproteobacteria bacterium]
TLAFILIPIVTGIIVNDNPIFLVVTAAGCSLLLNYEVALFAGKAKDYSHIIIISALLISLFIIKYLFLVGEISKINYSQITFFLLLLSVFLPGLIEVFKTSFELSIQKIGLSVMGFLYMGVIFGHVVELRFFINFSQKELSTAVGIIYLIYIFTIPWVYDTGGYFIGKYLGKKKIGLPASPNKSWAGFMGGLIFVILGYFIWYQLMGVFYPNDLSQVIFYNNHQLGVFFSISIAIFSQFGDLVESVFKRSAGVKDSSSIIPGHGGLFDAIDSVITTSCLFFYLLLFIENKLG